MIRQFSICVFASLLLVACNAADEPGHDGHEHGSVMHSPDTVTLTHDQLAKSPIRTVNPERQTVYRILTVRGLLDVPPQNLLNITAPFGGVVKRTPLLPGDHVNKGATLVVLQDREFIRLQQEYLTTDAKLEAAELELNRQQTLAADNVNARKTLELARSEVNVLRIAKRASAEQLALIGIDARLLTPETLSRDVTIKAPFNGYVTQVYVNTGSAVQPNGKILDMVDPTHLHAELQVYERDASLLQEGQLITVQIVGETNTRSAHIHLVGTEVNEDRTVVVHAHLDKNDIRLRPGTSLTAKIAINPHQALTVPETSVYSANSTSWVFVEKQPGVYYKQQVQVGDHTDGFVEIKSDAITENTPVVVQGLR